ncbi:MAG TPA: transcriptional regulator NrdR [Acidimicrobiia bacterium]|nr:transcriptional regulator NrdR [Acidimicrobiia bacterium]
MRASSGAGEIAHGGSVLRAGPPWLRRRLRARAVRSTVARVRCPFCDADDDKVVDSRPAEEGAAVRRRRECLACGRRYTTYERVDELPVMVVKRAGTREPFDAEKVRAGIERAVAGSSIDPAAVDALTAEVEEAARARGQEVTSEWIGRTVLERLRVLDPVSAVRFASVYKGFDDLGDFEREVVELQKSTAPKHRRA